MTSSDYEYPLEVERKQLHVIEWNHLNLYKFYPMALATSWSVRCMLYPMSVVKSRLQLQKKNNVYRGMTHAFRTILKNEGITALYRGFWVTLPQLSASFVYSSVYEKLRNVIREHTRLESPQVVSALAGGTASVCTQFVFVPTDIVAQYMMVHHNPKQFTGGNRGNAWVLDILHRDGLEKRYTLGLRVMRAVYKADGLLGFYRGFLSSLMMYIPSSMVFWIVYYDSLIRMKKAYTQIMSNGETADFADLPKDQQNLLALQATAGACSGLATAVVTNPLEVLRIRIQVHRTNYWDTIRRMYRYEGAAVFTKGLPPRLINSGIYSCLIMIGYETVKRHCVLPEYESSIVW
ncbi:unnamed protein product [Bursaphelenchus xylophilus]|uniref:(pine wood nematode) hypothetical protein n=1 Tax=Bursaphelenchus xylophilus TaxID=6326 RepID=A0A1I7S1T0_BURXY|nr:unnamed protein product [Bursaphelenchus xylophilus]CAG9089909.1 unnamed protein product [Bursaphelenchus xylophilus]